MLPISLHTNQLNTITLSVCYLQDSEVFENTVHHVLFRQMFEFVDKVDHVFAHRRAVDPVNALSSLQAGILRLRHTHSQQKMTHTVNDSLSTVWEYGISLSSHLYFLDNLLAKRADFG